jgi:hypothetical protein
MKLALGLIAAAAIGAVGTAFAIWAYFARSISKFW